MLNALNRQERQTRRALKALARQRVALVLQPGNVWVIERARTFEGMEEALQTCRMRGWVEVLENAVPSAEYSGEVDLSTLLRAPEKTLYRLTQGGWAEIQREFDWLRATLLVATLSLLVALAGLWLTIAT